MKVKLQSEVYADVPLDGTGSRIVVKVLGVKVYDEPFSISDALGPLSIGNVIEREGVKAAAYAFLTTHKQSD